MRLNIWFSWLLANLVAGNPRWGLRSNLKSSTFHTKRCFQRLNWFFRKEARPPSKEERFVPIITLSLLRANLGFVYRVRGQSFSQVRHLELRYVSLSNNRSIRSRRSENHTNYKEHQTQMSLLPSWRYVARNSLLNDSRWEVSALSEVKVALEDWFYSIREINSTYKHLKILIT